ncbi:hypothetical protein [uncultured Microscilla sp.]|uniref:hypothetical protein n=1 Tax=uncultured Microscilla sp. TaxID=432653 RepID=UPI00263877F1|nr:hypothetical protein [uncultured Microscilla sp.]
MADIFNLIIVLVSSIAAVAISIYFILNAFKSLEDGGGILVLIISLPIALTMFVGGGMGLLWLLSQVPGNALMVSIAIIVIVSVAYLFKQSKLSLANVWASTVSTLVQSVKVFSKMLFWLALAIGIGWLALVLLDSFWNTTDTISIVSILIFIFSALYLLKFNFNFNFFLKRKATIRAAPPKQPTLNSIEKKANQLWKNAEPKNDSEEFWTQYESLIQQVKKM